MKTLLVTAALVVAGCSSYAEASPAAVPTASPIAVASSASVATPSPTARSPTATPVATKPTSRPTPTFSKAERLLLEMVRADTHIGCVPKRVGLPARAIAGVECHLDGKLVSLVGAYRFRSEEDAAKTYFERLAEYGVLPRTGDCQAGTSGDSAWPDYLPDRGDDGGLSPYRSGCFLNGDGVANIRLTCYAAIYMGVVGENADLSALYRWAWRVASGESTHRDPPGLCTAPD